MKVSLQLLPEQPAEELLAAIELADRVGYYACYSADETYHKDPWLLFAAAAGRTERIRLGPCAAPIFLRDPTLVAQAAATLDELSGGRAEVVFGMGNVALLEQCGIEWRGTRPMDRLREAHALMRMLLDEGKADFAGDFYRVAGVFTAARPVRRVPLMLGAMGGPRSMRLAGEIADGMHTAAAYSPAAIDYAVRETLRGAEAAGRSRSELDIGDSLLGAIAADAETARRAGRVLAAFYVPSMPEPLLARHGIAAEAVQPVNAAFARGDVDAALAAAPDELLDRLVVAGSPDDWCERLARDVLGRGLDHLLVSFADPFTVHRWAGVTLDGLPTLAEQIALVADHVVPALDV